MWKNPNIDALHVLATVCSAGVGLRLFATVDWGHLGNVEIWQAAATQILYSNSCALGVLPTYASFNREHQVRDGKQTPR